MKTWILILLLHGSATFDAWTTNQLMNHRPPGWGSTRELNPLLRPWAGKKSLYPVVNLTVLPLDIWLLKRPKSSVAKTLAVGLIGARGAVGWHNAAIQRARWQEYDRQQAAMREQALNQVLPLASGVSKGAP